MQLHLKIIGIILTALALVHIAFPKYFNWKEELSSLNLINRQMMAVHTFFIGLIVFLMGILCLTSYEEIISTNLGKKISFGLGIFWTIRLIIQFIGYSSQHWMGKTFETLIHFVFIFMWSYLSFIFWSIALK